MGAGGDGAGNAAGSVGGGGDAPPNDLRSQLNAPLSLEEGATAVGAASSSFLGDGGFFFLKKLNIGTLLESAAIL